MGTPLDDVLAWLRTLTPIEQARVLSAVLDSRNAAVLSDLRVTAVYEATRTAPYAEVAARLGVRPSIVNKAVTTYNRTRLVAPTN